MLRISDTLIRNDKKACLTDVAIPIYRNNLYYSSSDGKD